MARGSTVALVASIFIISCASGHYPYKQFLHVSDFHLDPLYETGTKVSNLCHKSSFNLSTRRDADEEEVAGEYGSFKCDAPKILVQSAIQYMKRIVPNPDFILWTGDTSPHYRKGPEWDQVYANMRYVTRHLYRNFPKSPIIPALGNHDSYPPDSFEDFTIDPDAKEVYSRYLKDGSLADLIGHEKEAAEKFKECGFYVLRNHKLYADARITQTFIVLNTNLYYDNGARTNASDPCGQLQWLKQELQKSDDEGENVFILGHVPPGFFELLPVRPFFQDEEIVRKLNNLVTQDDYADKIVAHFYGHTHTSSFRILTNDRNQVKGVMFIAPSVTPKVLPDLVSVNPSVRVYDYDVVGRRIVGFKQYYLPLDHLKEDDDDDDPDLDGVDGSDESDEKGAGNKPNNFQPPDRRLTNSRFRDFNRRIFEREVPDEMSAAKDPAEDTTVSSFTADVSANSAESSPAGSTDAAVSTSTTVTSKTVSVTVSEDVSITTTSGPADPHNSTNDGTQSEREPEESVAFQTTTEFLAETTATADRTNILKPLHENTTLLESINATGEFNEGNEGQEDEDYGAPGDDIQELVDLWRLAFDAGKDLQVIDMTPKRLYLAYRNMKNNPNGSIFLKFKEDITVLHDGEKPCNASCHAGIVCALTNMLKDDLTECLQEFGVEIRKNQSLVPESATPPSSTSAPSTTFHKFATESTEATDQSNQESVVQPSAGHEGPGAARAVGIFVALLVVVSILGLGIFTYRKKQRSRYRSQEFLLTDSVFKYDGYSQLDRP